MFAQPQTIGALNFIVILIKRCFGAGSEIKEQILSTSSTARLAFRAHKNFFLQF
jgi:hypothetical protein